MYLHGFPILDDVLYIDSDADIGPGLEDSDFNIVKKDKGRTHSLNHTDMAEVMKFYRAKYPRLTSSEALYEAEKDRARLARKLASFPPIASWQPESYHLSPEEVQMIRGGGGGVMLV